MRIWRWNVTIERVPRYTKPDPGPRWIEEWLLTHHSWPDECIVRNTRTGESCLVRDGDLVRGVGSIAPTPILHSDEWIVLTIAPAVVTHG